MYKAHCLGHDDYVGVVAYVAACRAQVDYRLCRRALHAERVHVAHDVVAHFLFARFCNVIVDVLGVCLHFGYLLVGYVKPQLLFAFGKGNP